MLLLAVGVGLLGRRRYGSLLGGRLAAGLAGLTGQSRWWLTLLVLVLGSLLGSGCKVDAFCLDCEEDGAGSGGTEGGRRRD
jgi:hypothetical protein